jgi:uncharacterized protein YqjF (DUF2071 family)
VSFHPFLTAEWRHLAMLNWPVSPDLLAPHVPAGCELDLFDGAAYISVVAFLFENTRVFGVPVPAHRTFEEINLRFYVRRIVDGEVRRGVSFLREFVPRHAVAALARWLYNEPYRTVPMDSLIDGGLEPGTIARRVWYQAFDLEIEVETNGSAMPLAPGSIEEFIAEHYWGYTAQRDGSTIEYRVEHPRWRVARALGASVTGDLSAAYGPAFGAVLADPPESAWVADGSEVTVFAAEDVAVDA